MSENPSAVNICELCNQPMPKGEEMFKFHGFSCRCPGPSVTRIDENKSCNYCGEVHSESLPCPDHESDRIRVLDTHNKALTQELAESQARCAALAEALEKADRCNCDYEYCEHTKACDEWTKLQHEAFSLHGPAALEWLEGVKKETRREAYNQGVKDCATEVANGVNELISKESLS